MTYYFPHPRIRNKKKAFSILLKSTFLSLLLLFLFTSCGSNTDVFAKRKYQKGRFTVPHENYGQQKTENEETVYTGSQSKRKKTHSPLVYQQKKSETTSFSTTKNQGDKRDLRPKQNKSTVIETDVSTNTKRESKVHQTQEKSVDDVALQRNKAIKAHSPNNENTNTPSLPIKTGLLSIAMLAFLFLITEGGEEEVEKKFPLKSLWWRILLTLVLCIVFVGTLAPASIIVGLFLFSELFIVGIILGLGLFWIITVMAIFLGLLIWSWRNPSGQSMFRKALLYGLIGLIFPVFIYKFNIFLDWD